MKPGGGSVSGCSTSNVPALRVPLVPAQPGRSPVPAGTYDGFSASPRVGNVRSSLSWLSSLELDDPRERGGGKGMEGFFKFKTVEGVSLVRWCGALVARVRRRRATVCFALPCAGACRPLSCGDVVLRVDRGG